jgi:hypothetical protein
VNTVMNLRVLFETANFLTRPELLIASQEGLYSKALVNFKGFSFIGLLHKANARAHTYYTNHTDDSRFFSCVSCFLSIFVST